MAQSLGYLFKTYLFGKKGRFLKLVLCTQVGISGFDVASEQ